ncbi:MAG: hypothetical protein K0Q72_935 [Armatimonadetes bacterium]|jgi:hypothetical protein|nr:hypothetical protein [Armatimonadota bacterium]
MNTSEIGPTPDEVLAATHAWIERAVIGLNLCPFAKAVYVKGQIRYAVTQARNDRALLDDLERELRALAHAAPEAVETTLLIHPWALQEFPDYCDFLSTANAAIKRLGLSSVLQIASFHPAYQFADTTPHDVTNCTNRSPYPMLHLLREASMDRAVAAFPESQEIYQRNIEVMRRLGVSGWEALVHAARLGGVR